MDKFEKSMCKMLIGCVVAFMLAIVALNFIMYRQDPIVHNKHTGTLTYRVYYTGENIVDKKVYRIYEYSVSSYRGSNRISVYKNNVSTWCPVLKHVGLMESEIETTAPIEIISFIED